MYTLNNEELTYILDYTTSLTNVDSFGEFCRKILKLQEFFNFEYVNIGELRLNNSWGLKLHYTSCDYLKGKSSIAILEDDIGNGTTLKGVFGGTGLMYWNSAPDYIKRAAKKFYGEDISPSGYTGSRMRSNNMAAYTISFFSSTEIAAFQTDMYLSYLMPHLLANYSRLIGAGDNVIEDLSEREMDVIKWLKHGKTSWEVSKILDISENTVNFHIKNIKRKLNATNRQHAVAIAIANNLIS